MTSTLDKKISFFIKHQFPRYFREEGKNLVDFIETYYKFLEENGKALDYSRRIKEFRDAHLSEDKFFEFLKYEFMNSMPDGLVVDERLFINNILKFYKTKGSADSFRLMFRIMYDEDIEIYYPGDDILKPSDGRWDKRNYIPAQTIVDFDDNDALGLIFGLESGASADVTLTARIQENYTDILKMYVENTKGTFKIGEQFVNLANTVLGTIAANLSSDGGQYIGSYGQLSSDKYLQDSNYYQEFSYVIKSGQPLNNYKQALYNTVHPSGTKLFGMVNLGGQQFDIPIDFTAILDFTGAASGKIFIDQQIGQIDINLGTFLDRNFNNDNIIYQGVGADSYIQISNSNGLLGDGTVETRANNTVLFHANNYIYDYLNIPIELIGSRQVLYGNNTLFTLSVNTSNQLLVLDQAHSNTSVDVDTIYGLRAMKITSDYPYPEDGDLQPSQYYIS